MDHSSRYDDDAEAAQAERPVLRWIPTDSLPSGSTVKLILHGLLGLCYTREGFCEVAVLDSIPKHQLRVNIFESGMNEPKYSYNADQLTRGTFTLEIRQTSPNVRFFQAEGFNRAAPHTSHSNDFRWIVDFENPDEFYPIRLRKHLVFRPKLLVKNGTFHTVRRTASTFYKRNERIESDKAFGHIAHWIGANLYLEESQEARLTMGRVEHRFPEMPGKTYEIHFTNACEESDGRTCEYDEDSSLEERRNDFHHYYQSFEIPPGMDKLGLKLHRRGREEASDQELGLLGDIRPASTDEAPCGSSGFGQSTQIP